MTAARPPFSWGSFSRGSSFRGSSSWGSAWAPWILSLVIPAGAAILLKVEGRRWWCACGQAFLWSGEIHSAHNSQHLADAYTLTHVSHGLLFFALCTGIGRLRQRWGGRPLSTGWRLVLALLLESGWEVLENSEFVIDRYRTATMFLGYSGDSIVNSLGDVAACAAGFGLARLIGVRAALVLFVATELLLLATIRDNLTLNVLMLLLPLRAIRDWQTG